MNLLHVFEELVFPSFGKLKILDFLLIGSFDDFVLDVSDVHTEFDVVAEVVPQDPSEHIIADVVPE